MKNNSSARRQRRLYEKYLKKTSLQQYKEWKSNSVKRGEEYHKQHTESTMKDIESQFENLQSRVIHTMKTLGKNDVEINEYVEDWLSSTKIWAESDSPERFNKIKKKRESND